MTAEPTIAPWASLPRHNRATRYILAGSLVRSVHQPLTGVGSVGGWARPSDWPVGLMANAFRPFPSWPMQISWEMTFSGLITAWTLLDLSPYMLDHFLKHNIYFGSPQTWQALTSTVTIVFGSYLLWANPCRFFAFSLAASLRQRGFLVGDLSLGIELIEVCFETADFISDQGFIECWHRSRVDAVCIK